jgi:hypothetical protein
MGGGRRPQGFVRGRLEPGKDSPSHQKPFAEIDFHVNMGMLLKDIKFSDAKRLAFVKQPKVINDFSNGIESQLVVQVVAETIRLTQ